MEKLIHTIIRRRRAVVTTFIVLAIICACMIPFVRTNYNMVDYLPDDAQSTTAVEMMGSEFDQAIPNANVLVHDLTIPEAIKTKHALKLIEGVEDVTWLDDVTDLKLPLETLDAAMLNTYYKLNAVNSNETRSSGTALFQVVVADTYEGKTIPEIRSLIDRISQDKAESGQASLANAVSGDAADTAQMQASTVEEVLGAVAIIVPIILLLLVASTMSWIEPLLFAAAIGISIVINMGTNIFLGEVSFITYSVSPILQLAVSLDYAIFLLHAFAEERKGEPRVEDAMACAMRRSVSTIAASAVTTLFGFAALAFMQFQIGADLGINLVKGIVFSFLTVALFLPALTLCMYKLIDKTHHRRLMPSFKNVDVTLSKVRIPTMMLVIVLIVPAALGQAHTAFTYQNSSPDTNIRNGADAAMVTDEFGLQNAAVVLVPRGDVAAERQLSHELEEIDNVRSVMSYATTIGSVIPPEYVGESIVEQFYSDNWARMIAYVDTDAESEEAFTIVQAIQDAAANHYEESYVAGQSANLYDMSQIVAVDNVRVSVIAVIAIFLVLLVTFRSLGLPLVLLLTIESGIWINLSIPYFMGESINFIGYLVINTVQLGATIDYGILLTSRYLEYRKACDPKQAIKAALGDSFRSILVSAAILATAGFALAATSSLSAVSSLGFLLGRGAILSLLMVTCFLPGLLVYLDTFIRVTTLHANFHKGRDNDAAQDESLPKRA